MKRILVLRLGAIGDVVQATPALRAIRRAWPECRLEFLVRRRWAPILKGNPNLSVIHCVEETGLLSLCRLARSLGRFDLLLDLHGNLASRMFCLAVRAGRVLRAPKDGLRRRMLVQFGANFFFGNGGIRPVSRRYQAGFRRLGIEPDDGPPEVFPDPQARRRVESELPEGGLGIAPAAGRTAKRWPAERFREAAARLADPSDETTRPVVAFGSPEDRAVCEEATRGLPGARVFLSEDIGRTIAGLSRCRLLLSNDTGLMHLAGALGLPVVAVFGPTVAEFGFWPFSPSAIGISRELPCKPCSLWGGSACYLGHHRCMTSIPAQEVAARGRELLRKIHEG